LGESLVFIIYANNLLNLTTLISKKKVRLKYKLILMFPKEYS